MQQIERYGIIALLFLVVSIVVVALWDPEPGGTTPAATEGQARVVAAAPARQQVTRQAPRQQASNSRFSDRAAAPATGPRGTRVVQRSSAPLDMGQEAAQRNRGRNASRSNQAASSSRPAMPVAEAPKFTGPPALTREKTRPNQGARRTAEALEAQRATELAASREAARRANLAAARKAAAPPAKAALVSASTQRSRPVAQPKGPTYVVRAGDSLERIARRELGDGARWREVAKLNGISNPNLVRVGQKLTMPTGAKAAAQPSNRSVASKNTTSNTRPVATSGAGTYVVAKGDVLSRIAERQLGSSKRWREIVALNPGLDPAKLYVGKRLVMPGKGATPAAPAQRAPARNRVAQASPDTSSDNSYVVQ